MWIGPNGEKLYPDLDPDKHTEGGKWGPHWDYWPGKNGDKIRINPNTGKPLQPGEYPLPDGDRCSPISPFNFPPQSGFPANPIKIRPEQILKPILMIIGGILMIIGAPFGVTS
jgi:hypothetical protein